MCARHTLHAARSRCITHTHRVQPQRRQGVQPGVATRVGSANFSNRHIADAIQRKTKGKGKERKAVAGEAFATYVNGPNGSQENFKLRF